MSKFFLLYFIIVWSICTSAQLDSTFTMNQTALAEYYKISVASRGTFINLLDDKYVVNINSFETHKIFQKPIELQLDKIQFDAIKSGHLTMKLNDSIAIENNLMSLHRSNNRGFEFELKFTDNSQLLSVSSDSTPPSNIGYLIVQHRLGKYCNVRNPITNRSFSLGIFDKINLGVIDKEDIMTLSYDNFFKPQPNRFSCKLQDSIIVNFENTIFLIEWLGAYNVRYTLIDSEHGFDLPVIYLDENLEDFRIEELDELLSSQLKTDKTLFNFWAGFCPPCIESIPKFNDLGEKIIGFQLDKEERKIDSVQFKNYSISPETLSFLAINGFPNYIVVDRNLRIMYSGRNAQEAIDILMDEK